MGAVAWESDRRSRELCVRGRSAKARWVDAAGWGAGCYPEAELACSSALRSRRACSSAFIAAIFCLTPT